jgi:hypothetical protein
MINSKDSVRGSPSTTNWIRSRTEAPTHASWTDAGVVAVA